MTGGMYGWFPWVQGTMTAQGETFNAYATPIDLIENFDAPPIMVNFEARRGKFSFWGDALWTEFAFNDEFVGEGQPNPFLDLSGRGASQTDFNLGIFQLGAFYEVADFVGPHGNQTTVELGAGARWIRQEFRLRADIDASAQLRLNRLADRLEQRIERIANREQRLEALAALNDVRSEVLEDRIVRAQDKGRDKLVKRLENRLRRIGKQSDTLEALKALEAFRFELARAALNLDGKSFSDDFTIINSGTIDLVSPTIALRLQHHFADGQYVTAVGDFGGFNINSQLSTQMELAYNIDGELWGFETTTTLGYRALWLSFEEQTAKGERGMDVWLHGPLAEVLLRW